MSESFFVLAAVFIALGAIGFAYRVYIDRDRELPPRISADYIRGLNLVLNRQTDEALELFVQMAKVDEDTLETHFALGHLFRRRGEVERAIRVHENLLARPNLNDAQRHQALFSLAEDYLGAGLFDRAEKLFAELVESPTLAEAALEKLVHIYEREREWLKAVDARRKLEIRTGEKSPQVAHYWCELADQARQKGDLAAAREHLRNTIRSETGAVRGTLIRASIAREEGNHTQALMLYEQVLTANRHFIAEMLPAVLESFRTLGRVGDFDAEIERWVSRDPTLRRDFAYAAIISDLEGSKALDLCVEEFVFGNEVLASLVNADELKVLPVSERASALARIAKGLRQIALSNARYRCGNCGYSTQRFIWHCPSCKLWETMRPIQNFQLEAMLS
jgi:lipopolysaccharide biosynthesis regulator YciM